MPQEAHVYAHIASIRTRRYTVRVWAGVSVGYNFVRGSMRLNNVKLDQKIAGFQRINSRHHKTSLISDGTRLLETQCRYVGCKNFYIL